MRQIRNVHKLILDNSRDFLTSNIIGATNLEQLKENINSVNIKLSSDLLKEIDEIHNENPFPCP